MSDRTFKIESPPMRGDDIRAWQGWLNDKLAEWRVNTQIDEDGIYGGATRAMTRSIGYGMGLDSPAIFDGGITPELRIKMRNTQLTDEEKRAREARLDWKDRFRDHYAVTDLHTPINHIITHANGWTGPNGHDGVDLICDPNAPLLAICDGVIVRVSAAGWWGNNPQPSPGHPISDGDGIIILESTTNHGIFVPGLHFGYGHAEHAIVNPGQHVKAGHCIGLAGFARAWHSHFMVNNDPPVNGLYRGVGDRDPWPYVDFAIKEQN